MGALVGGLIEVFVSRTALTRWLPRRTWQAVLLAAGMGLVLPVCECAVIPVTRRLIGKGVPFAVALAYLLAGPIVNPLVAASTAVAYAGTPGTGGGGGGGGRKSSRPDSSAAMSWQWRWRC